MSSFPEAESFQIVIVDNPHESGDESLWRRILQDGYGASHIDADGCLQICYTTFVQSDGGWLDDVSLVMFVLNAACDSGSLPSSIRCPIAGEGVHGR